MLDAGLLSLFTDGKTQLSGLEPILILTAAACMPQQEPQEREREREREQRQRAQRLSHPTTPKLLIREKVSYALLFFF